MFRSTKKTKTVIDLGVIENGSIDFLSLSVRLVMNSLKYE